MSNAEDKLNKEDRALVELLHGGYEFKGDVKRLLSIVDKLAPKPIDLVPGTVAIADMLTRKDAVYKEEIFKQKIKFDFTKYQWVMYRNAVWTVINLVSSNYQINYIKIS